MEILIAFIVMFSVALLAGGCLAVFSHFFAVTENPLKKQVREHLPGINCGACGYKGCDDYAAALADGGVSPSLCIPGAQAVADQIGALLGVEAESFSDVVAFVSCDGHCDAVAPKAVYEGVATCQAASMVYGGANACRFGCVGLGDCAASCPANAICVSDGVARVNTDRCLGCGLCVTICPKNIIRMLPQKTTTVVMCSSQDKGAEARKACKSACIGCKKCEKTCPNNAISVKNNLAVIDYSRCTNCEACVRECPTGCLRTVFFPDIPEGVGYEDLLH